MSEFEPFERPRYFAGQLLTADDLQREQDYLRGRACRHNRYLHGWGIVSGLEVTLDGTATVRVSPGLALDCAGNELVLPAPELLSLSGLIGRHYVTLHYVEALVRPQPVMQGETEFSGIVEAVRVELVLANPAAGHAGKGPGTPGCGEVHAVSLATLRQHGTHWRVAPAKRGVLHRR